MFAGGTELRFKFINRISTTILLFQTGHSLSPQWDVGRIWKLFSATDVAVDSWDRMAAKVVAVSSSATKAPTSFATSGIDSCPVGSGIKGFMK